MVTEIDLLKEDIPRLEMKFGRGNPFVELLKAELESLQNQAGQQPLDRQDHRGYLNPKNSLLH
jgi:hypothetical protein